MRSGKPDPLAADVVHVGEDGGDGADVAGRFYCRLRSPRRRVEVFDYELVHALVGGKDLEGGMSEIRGIHWLGKFRLTGAHRWTLGAYDTCDAYCWRIKNFIETGKYREARGLLSVMQG